MKFKAALLLPLLCLLTGQCLGQSLATPTPCFKVLSDMTQELQDFTIDPDVSTLSNNTKCYAAFSGRYVDDFGDYNMCQNQTTNYYLTLEFNGTAGNATFSGMVGFCAPVNCSFDDVQDPVNINQIFKLYKAGGFPLGSITNASNVTYYDPKSDPPGDKATTYIIIAVICFVALLVVVATIMGGIWEAIDEAKAKPERLFRESGDPTIDFTGVNRDSTATVVSPPAPPKPKRELKGIFKFLDCFDARKNLEKIVKVKYTPTYDFNLEIFNGIRVLMMLYVVYGHSFLFGIDYIDNLADITDLTNSWWLLIPNSALYAVDVFFYMSGFLFAYIGLGKLKKMRPNLKNFFGLALHRFLRFWPTYVLALIFFWRVLPLLGEGPIWFRLTYYTSLCDGNYWQNLLLIDDILVQSANYCFGWGWYLSNDYQMFLLTPFFLWLYIRNRKAGKWSMVVLMIISYGLALWIGAELNLKGSPPKAGVNGSQKGFSAYYVKPYIRLPPYFIGVLVALLYKEYKEQIGSSYRIGTKLKSSKLAMNLIAIIGAIFLLVLTFLPRMVQGDDDAWPEWFHDTWRCFQKSAYVVAMTMLFLPILLGENNFLKRFLAHPIFVPLARLSFTAYLVHLCWIYLDYYDAHASFHFTFSNVLYNTLANGVVAFTVGLLLSLLAEIPMANIEQTYLTRQPRHPKKVGHDDAQRAKLNNLEELTVPIINKKHNAKEA